MLERIARHADIDTRRAMGIYGRLPVSNLVPKGEVTTFVYFQALNKVVYISFIPGDFWWEVYEDIRINGDMWSFGPNGRSRGIWQRKEDEFVTFDHSEIHNGPFHFAGPLTIL